jgi:putative membrane protein
MRKLLFSVLGILILFIATSCQDQHRAKNYNDKTLADDAAIHFIKNGIEGSLVEIKAANIAKNKSSNPNVINFANMMITDHTETVNELKKIQADKLVDSRDSINEEHQSALNGLSSKQGVEFDKAYIEMMIMDHEKAIELFKGIGNNTSGVIQKFAEKTLPSLQTHLDEAEKISESLK